MSQRGGGRIPQRRGFEVKHGFNYIEGSFQCSDDECIFIEMESIACNVVASSYQAS